MQTIDDIIQSVARARTRPDGNPILFWRSLASDVGQRVSHLSVSNELGQAWVAMMGEPFRPHQAHALAMLRRHESIALRSESASLQQSLFLLISALFETDRTGMGLVLTDDEELAEAVAAMFDQLNKGLPASLRLPLDVITPQTRFYPQRRLLICPAELVHARLLGHHDRAWAPFWSRLRLIAVPEIQRFRGVAGTHLTQLLRRCQRTAATHASDSVPLLATLPPMLNAEPALMELANQPVRVVNADDSGQHGGLIVVWRSGSSLMRDIADLAAELNRNKIRVHVLCSMLEQAALQPVLGDMQNVTSGPHTEPGTVLICVGVPESLSNLRRLIRGDHETVILVLGELLQEQQFARQPDLVLTAPVTSWAVSPPNAYVVAQHLLCAASERDLQADEVEQWGLQRIVDRLVENESLVELPDLELAWKPGPQARDPYQDMSLLSASGVAVDVATEAGHLIANLDPTALERWAFPGAALPPLRGGLGVLGHDEDSAYIHVRTESSGRRTFPLRRCQIKPRDQGQSRMLVGGLTLTLTRIMVEEVVEGYREHIPGSQATQKKLQKPLSSGWTAPACCLRLAAAVTGAGQLVGWSMAAALALYASAEMIDLVPCYDEQSGMLYLVDAQPGGSGLAAWLYENAEQLFQLAFDIAYAGRHDALLEPLCRNDRDWLQVVLGKAAPTRESGTVFITAPEITEAEQPFIELGPPPNRPEPGSSAAGQQQSRSVPAENQPAREKPAAEKPAVQPPGPIQRPLPPVSANPPASEQPAAQKPGSIPEPKPAQAAAPEQVPPEKPPAREPPAAPRQSNAPQQRPSAAEPPASTRPASSRDEPSRPEKAPAQPDKAGATEKPAVSLPEKSAARPTSPPRQTGPDAGAKPPSQQKQRPQQAPPPEPEETTDAAALIARLRRQREQRESQQQSRQTAGPKKSALPSGPVLQRFKTGDHVFCLPYGDGVVYESRVEQGRELLIVTFPDYGDLEIDTEVNLVRHIKTGEAEQDDLL